MGVTVLQEVVTANTPLGSREVARRLNLEHSRVNRVLGTLVHIGMLRQDESKKYSVGPGIHALSAQSLHASGLVSASLGPLSDLHGLGATVALGVVWRDSVVYLLHARPDMNLASTVGAHETFPVRESIIADALAASEPVVRRNRPADEEVAFAAAIGVPRFAAVAAVFPEEHELMQNPDDLQTKVEQVARTIEQNIQDGGLS